MNNITSIIVTVRNLIEDNAEAQTDIFVYTGASSTFTLTEGNVNSITTVEVNEVESGVTYTENGTLTKIDITSDLTIDDIVEVAFNCYSDYSDTELTAYVKSAIAHLSVYKVCSFAIDDVTMYPEPSNEVADLIAVIAATIINPENVSYRMPDVTVTLPKGLSTSDKISKIVASFKRAGNTGEMFIAEDGGNGRIF